jgi:hypothetical protein
MNSIAIWYEKEGDATGTVPEIDLHINHWKLKFKRNFFVRKLRSLSSKTLGKLSSKFVFHNSDYFMDIGMKISKGQNIKNVCIYVPCDFSDKSKLIEDIGHKLVNKRLVTAVFNEPYNTTTGDSKYFTVTEGNSPLFNIYMLDVSNDIKIEKQFGGTVIKFAFKNFNIPTYYRIRLKAPYVTNLSYVFKPSTYFLESAYSSIEIIDFRINDSRNLNLSLLEHIASHYKFNIRLVHYFVMRNIKDEYIVSNYQLSSVRQLEDDTWTSYINENEYIYEKSFAYHLKRKAEEKEPVKYIEDFSAVIKYRFEDSKLLKYFLYLFLFAMITEVLGSALYDLCKLLVASWLPFR